MILLGKYIRIQKNLKNIAMLNNSQEVFVEIPKISCEKVLPFMSIFWLGFDFSYFNQCFFQA